MRENARIVAKGGALIELVVGAVAILTGGIGLLILDAVTCDFNVIFSSGCGTVESHHNKPKAGEVCTSSPNSCGMSNTGFIVKGTNAQTGKNVFFCNADVPSDSLCGDPTLDSQGFIAKPSTVGLNATTTLSWNAGNATSCTVSGDDGFTSSGGATGSVSSNPLVRTTSFTLTCTNDTGGDISKSVRVIVDPHYKEI